MHLRHNLRMAVWGAFMAAVVWGSLYSARRDPPLVKISAITPLMSFSSVRIEGVLEADAREMRGGEMFYWVGDGSGTMAVFARQKPSGCHPLAGDRVSVVGCPLIGADGSFRLRAQTVEIQSSVDRSAKSKRVDIDPGQKGERVTVSGRVSAVWTPPVGSRAPHKIVLEMDGGLLDVVHWLDDAPNVEAGDVVEVHGSIDIYKGKVELKVWEAGDIRHH